MLRAITCVDMGNHLLCTTNTTKITIPKRLGVVYTPLYISSLSTYQTNSFRCDSSKIRKVQRHITDYPYLASKDIEYGITVVEAVHYTGEYVWLADMKTEK
jgi:hypothetical protein